MIDLKSFLAQEVVYNPRPEQQGTETDWMHFTTFECRSGKILAIDPMFAPNPDEGILVECLPGTYIVEAKVTDYSGDRRISSLRAIRKGSSPTASELKGEVGVDLALLGICDYEPFTKAAEIDVMAFEELFSQTFENEEMIGILQLEKPEPAQFIYVGSGFGDGCYPVTTLKQDDQNVGIEITFIEPGTSFPFEGNGESNDNNAESSALEDNANPVFEAFAEVLNQFQRTGDKTADKDQLKSLLELQSKKFEINIRKEVQNYWEYVVNVRKSAPSVRLILKEDPNPSLSNEEKNLLEDLQGLGFTVGSTYIPNMQNCQLTLAVDKMAKIMAEVFSGPNGVSVNLNLLLPHGQVLTIDNGEPAPGTSNPDWQKVTKIPGASVKELVGAVPGEALKSAERCNLANGAQLIVDLFRRTQEWRAERGGWNLDEIKQQNSGLQTASREEVNIVLEEVRTKWLVAWLRLKPEYQEPSEEFLRALVIIHEGHDSELLLNSWIASTMMLKVREHHFQEAGPDPLKAFASINKEYGSPLELIAKKSTGFKADFYMPRATPSK